MLSMKKYNQLTVSLRKRQLQEEYERLQAEYSNLIAVRDEMVQVEAPRLEGGTLYGDFGTTAI